MATRPSAKAIKEFMRNAKVVVCGRCGQEYNTVEDFKTCYVCSADMKTGIIFN